MWIRWLWTACLLVIAPSIHGAQHVSEHGVYLVQWDGPELAIGKSNRATLWVQRADAGESPQIRIKVLGWKAQPGSVKLPRVSLKAGEVPGLYQVEGLHFHHEGSWTLHLQIQDSGSQEDVGIPLRVGRSVAALSPPTPRASSISKSSLTKLRSFSLAAMGPPLPDSSNRYANNPKAIELGQRLFFEKRLSAKGQLSCASCHDPSHHFTNHRPHSPAALGRERDTPSLIGAGYSVWQFWDGRRDSLWSQALVPMESPKEMNSSRVALVKFVATEPSYRRLYEEIFGTIPKLELRIQEGGPLGPASTQAAWKLLSSSEQAAINRVFVNMGKAIAAYERQLKPGLAKFDLYLAALLENDLESAAKIFSTQERLGLDIFLSEQWQCAQCHSGPLFTNGEFKNIGTGFNKKGELDPARSFGLQEVLTAEFNCESPFSDDRIQRCKSLKVIQSASQKKISIGAFKVPSLRNVSETAPYMHDGRFAKLRDVMEHYRNPMRMGDSVEFRPVFDMSDQHKEALEAFLKTLSSLPET